MRKKGLILLVCLVIAGVYFLLYRFFPKNADFLPFLLVLFALDGYLWLSIKKKVFSMKPFTGYAVMGVYWLPLILFASSILTAMVIPFTEWNIPMQTYVLGTIGITYFCKLIPVFFLIITDFFRLVSFLFYKTQNENTLTWSSVHRIKFLQITGWVLGGGFFILMLIGMFDWHYDFRIRKVEIVIPELPDSFDGLKIVQFSDIHLGSWTSKAKLKVAVDLMNAQKPDMVFFTGDLVNYTTSEANGFISILSSIRAKEGIFSIMGNHDYGDYVNWSDPQEKSENFVELCQIYEKLRWNLLLNNHVVIHRGLDSIAVIGVENWGKSERFQRFGDVALAEKGVESMAVKLLLSHDPSHWDSIVSKLYKNIDITFAGHTHGFQFGFESDNIQWSPLQGISKYWAGLYSKPVEGSHPQYLYVNRGLGSIGYPGRIGILPEITVFTLRRR